MSDNLNEGAELLNKEGLMSLYSLSRSLDGIFWSLLAFYICLLSTIQDLVFASFPFLCWLPLPVISYCAFRIPKTYIDSKDWLKTLDSLKVYSLITTFTFPFIIFLFRGGFSNHFVICTIIAIYGVLRMLISVSSMAIVLGKDFGEESLAKEGKMAVYCIYASVFMAMIYMFMAVSKPMLTNSLLNSGTLGLIIKLAMLIIIVFPLLLPITLLFRLKSLIIFNTKEKLRKY